jgi:hypothetical protein
MASCFVIARYSFAKGTGQEEAVVANDDASRTRVRGGSLCDTVLLNVCGKNRKDVVLMASYPAIPGPSKDSLLWPFHPVVTT